MSFGRLFIQNCEGIFWQRTKKFCFCGEVLFFGFVVVEMVAGQICECRGFEIYCFEPVLVESMAGGLCHHKFCAGLYHLVGQGSDIEAVGCCQLCRYSFVTGIVDYGADEAALPA